MKRKPSSQPRLRLPKLLYIYIYIYIYIYKVKFPKSISAMWNANSLDQILNSGSSVYFLRLYLPQAPSKIDIYLHTQFSAGMIQQIITRIKVSLSPLSGEITRIHDLFKSIGAKLNVKVSARIRTSLAGPISQDEIFSKNLI